MAYDSYRSQPEPHKGHSASSYDYESQYRAPARGRSRASSSVGSDGYAQPAVPGNQPLRNAIGNAFEKSDAARVVDPDLIAQITEQVKKSVLDEIKMSVVANAAAQAQPAPVPQHHVPPSPASISASLPPRDVYTPPSPKHTDFSSQASQSPDPPARDPLLDGNNDTPTPRTAKSDPVNLPRERSAARPAAAARMPTDDYTPIEKMWQRLFDTDDQPLPRLGQFLRGLALHLVEDYEPKGSLVISPAKMLKFYEDVKLPDEIYPWQTLFGQLSYSSLSKVYRDMRCQHHMIQEHPADTPYIPALTPDGFQEWMTAMIQAYPDVEYERLSQAVLKMPISNADDRRERFPKELPRRLFPQTENLQAQQRCAANLSAEGVAPLRKAPSFPPPPPKAQPTAPPPNLERERSPYVSQPESNAIDSEDELEPSSIPIERQRKPYAATPGGGKVYDEDYQRSATTDATKHDQRRHRQSFAGSGPFAPPPADTHHDYSSHTRSGAQANTRRARSPSFTNPGTQSDPNMRDIPNNYYTSNLHSHDEDPRRYAKDNDSKKYDRDRHRRSTVDNYDAQSRSVYETDDHRGRHGSNGYESRGYDRRY